MEEQINIIKNYYASTSLPGFLMESTLSKFERNPDIAAEFAHWIETKEYDPNGVVIQGYSAKDLSQISEFLDGEGAFSYLIMLRENPEKALRQIKRGFVKR